MKCTRCGVELNKKNRADWLVLCKKCWDKVCTEATNKIPDEVFKPHFK